MYSSRPRRSLKADPSWAGMEAVAHTISYDGRVTGTTVSSHPPLVISGGKGDAFMRRSVDRAAPAPLVADLCGRS